MAPVPDSDAPDLQLFTVAPTGSLRLLCGPSNSGKVGAIHDLFLASCERDGGAWLVVPTQGDVVRTSAELARKASNGVLLGARIGTFAALVGDLGRDPSRPSLPAGADELAIRRLLVDLAPQFPEQRFSGFAATATRRIRELRSLAALDTSRLRAELSALPDREATAWAMLLARYDRWLDGAGLDDAAYLERRALEAVAGGALDVDLYAYGFDDLSDMQRALVKRASQHVSVVLSLPYTSTRYAFDRRGELIDDLKTAGAEVEESGEAWFGARSLAMLEQRVFEPTAEPLDDATGIELVTACGQLQEAEAIARTVAAELRNGVPAERIGVITAAPAGTRTVLAEAFARAGVPVAFELPTPLIELAAGRALHDAFEAAATGDEAALGRFLMSAMSGVERSRAARIVHGDVAPGFDPWRTVPQLQALAEADPATVVDRALAFLRSRRPATAIDARVLDQLCDTLIDLREARVRPTVAELAQLLAAIRRPAPADRPPGCVLVAPISRVRTERFDTVVLYGLHEGGWGGSSAADPAIVRELAYVAVTRPRSRLMCVRQAATSDGREVAAHVVWHEVARLAPAASRHDYGLAQVVCVPGEAVTAAEVPLSLADAYASGSAVPPPWHARFRELAVGLHRSEDAGDAYRLLVNDPRYSMGVTSIERFGGCPARWFIEKLLLDSTDDPPGAHQVIGTLVHAVLQGLVPALDDPARPTIRQAIDRLLEWRGAEREHGHARTSNLDHATPAEVATAELAIRIFLEDEQPVDGTVLTEVSTRASGLDLQVDGLTVEGYIDRIDIRADGTSVIHDYKTGKVDSSASAANLVKNDRLQLPLYWKAVRDHGGDRIPPPVAALYRPLRSRASAQGFEPRARGLVDRLHRDSVPEFVRSSCLDAADISAVIDEAVERATQLVRAVRAGKVPASPREARLCDYCQFGAICRVESR